MTVCTLAMAAVISSASNEKVKEMLNVAIVTGDENNDLLKTSLDNYDGVRVFVTLGDAITAAEEGSVKGIMILADNYPNTTTVFTDTEAERLNALKDVRVYVEYPAVNEALGIVGYEGTDVMGYDRAVVTDAEALGMEKFSLLYVHGAKYAVKTDVSSSWLVNAKVAGYDAADFGLDGCEPCSMLELNDAGNVLIASTKLSQFISARYAPYGRWQRLWLSVLSWVGGTELSDVEWTPAMNANYGPDEELADDAYSEAVRLNTEWYVNSGLLIDGGSGGLLEGFQSGNNFDVYGEQSIRRCLRADCNGESIGALALAAQLLDNGEYKEVAYELMSWLLEDSLLSGGDRADVTKSQYGLFSWHDGAYNQYYGDDNAKAILGLILGASALETDEFDERILESIIANFRTSGVYGFRGSRLLAEDIESAGWEYYYNSTTVNYSSHFESLLWACYLWAYDKTGYEPLLTRTRTGISMMMTAYENTMTGDVDNGVNEWYFQNGIQQERAKMILPLAWLVRIEPTEEHISWLDRMISDLMAYQDEDTGALREITPVEGYGISHLPPFTDNSKYGTAEAPVIQNDGDPASDSLYTSSFAMMGLNEAYAAMASLGNTELANKFGKYAASLSDYHVRIQQISDNSKYSGAWFRGFDYEKWEVYGSDGDAGWGVWCVETGWSQAWISATLSLESMDTSIWDYTEASSIGDSFNDVALRMLDFDESKITPIPTYELSGEVGVRGTSSLLFDGLVGDLTTYTSGWFGAEGVDITLYVDYQRTVSFDVLSLGFFQDMAMGICVPAKITVYGSADGDTYHLIGEAVGTTDIQNEYDTTNGQKFRRLLSVTADSTESVRYIKVEIKSAGKFNNPNHGVIPHWIFMDELELSYKAADLSALKELIDTVSKLDTTDCQPATVIALDEALSAAIGYCNTENPDPDMLPSIYDALDAAASGLEKKIKINISSAPSDFTQWGSNYARLTDGKHGVDGDESLTAGQVKVVMNAYQASQYDRPVEFVIDLGSTQTVLCAGYSARSLPRSGIYSPNVDVYISDSLSGEWTLIGSAKGRPHAGRYQDVVEWHTISAECNGVGRYVKLVFSSNHENEMEYTSGLNYAPDNQLKVAEWFFPSEIFVNEFRTVDVNAENASVTVTDSNGRELSVVGAMLGSDVTVTVTPNDANAGITATVNGQALKVEGGIFKLECIRENQSVSVTAESYTERDYPYFVGLKDWVHQTSIPTYTLTEDLKAYDRNGKDISEYIEVISNNIQATAGTYRVTYRVTDPETGLYTDATVNVFIVGGLWNTTHVLAITNSTASPYKDNLGAYVYKLFDGVVAPEVKDGWGNSAFVRWQNTSPIEIVVKLGSETGVSGFGISIGSLPYAGFIPPQVSLYYANELGEWTLAGAIDAIEHPYSGDEELRTLMNLSYLVELDNVKAKYIKLVVEFDDAYANQYVKDNGTVLRSEWTNIDEIFINTYYSVTAESCENGSVTVSTNNEKGASWGESATVTVTPADGYYLKALYVNGVAVNATNGSYTITGITERKTVRAELAKIGIRGAALNLTESISLVYYAEIPDGDGAVMKFTVNGNDIIAEAYPTAEESVYAFFLNLPPQCMGDIVRAELYLDESLIDVYAEYSILDYCEHMLACAEEKSLAGYTDEQYAALVTLIADILNYGAEAQLYKGYKTDTLVNAGIVADGSEFTELDDGAAVSGSASESEMAEIVSGGVRFDNVNSIYLILEISDGANVSVSVSKINGAAMEYTVDGMIALGDGRYKLYTGAINPTDLDERYAFTVYVDGVEVQRLEYGVAAYVYYIQNEKNANGELTDMARLARATYNYGCSAKKYAELCD